jgi:uncharacterized LabA/DUF88 family protein
MTKTSQQFKKTELGPIPEGWEVGVLKDFKFTLHGKTLVIVDWANVHGWQKSLKWSIDPQRLYTFLASHSEIFDTRLYFGVEKGQKWSEAFQGNVANIGYTLVSKDVKFVPVSLDKSHFRSVIKNLSDVLDGVKSTNTEIATRLYEIQDSTLVGDLDTELKKLNVNISELQQSLKEPIMRRKCDFDVEITRDAIDLAPKFETLILFSGDGDYAALVENLIAKGKRVILVFAKGHKGKEYGAINKGLFQCPVTKMRSAVAAQQNIPPDFSEGRDVNNIPQIAESSNTQAGAGVDTEI